MNLPAWLSRREPRPPPLRFDFAAMEMEEDMTHIVQRDFAPRHPRDLDVPADDLFDAGLIIANQVIDWEETSGKSIAILVEHIKNTRKLRAQVIADANGEEPQS